MTNKWMMDIKDIPGSIYIVVSNISLESSEKTVKEFFLFCGKIQEFEMKIDDDDLQHKIALIHFERESSAKTATLLSNALIDDTHIIAEVYSNKHIKSDEKQTSTSKKPLKPGYRVAAEILANGYMLQNHVVAKGLEYDNRHDLSSRIACFLNSIKSSVKQLDERYHIWDKAVCLNQKYKIHERVQYAADNAQTKAFEALQSPTGQKVQDLAHQTLIHITAVHHEAKRIQSAYMG
ncbi:hypothetical protein BDB01DRAFT_52912 [Pilobolus umbonatus]|nr:hypothetical protein BDB01DRAFT_52912 [Pilobolus umbonatus]